MRSECPTYCRDRAAVVSTLRLQIERVPGRAAIVILLSTIDDVKIHKLWEILSKQHQIRKGVRAMERYREQQELSMSKQDLVMYPNQGRLVVYTLLIGLGLVVCSGLIVYWSFFSRIVNSSY